MPTRKWGLLLLIALIAATLPGALGYDGWTCPTRTEYTNPQLTASPALECMNTALVSNGHGPALIVENACNTSYQLDRIQTDAGELHVHSLLRPQPQAPPNEFADYYATPTPGERCSPTNLVHPLNESPIRNRTHCTNIYIPPESATTIRLINGPFHLTGERLAINGSVTPVEKSCVFETTLLTSSVFS